MDLLAELIVLSSLASALIGAIIEYCWHSISHRHRRRHHKDDP